MKTEAQKITLARELCGYLNELLALDEEAILAFCENRVPCNDQLADHPTIQVSPNEDTGISSKKYSVGILGIINGFVGVRYSDGYGYLCAVYNDEETKIIRFELTPPARKK